MITLLSDFGNQDAYVAIMKGVIAAIAPAETPCDLTHQILPQDILSARFNLKLAYPHFPSGTVHLAVVDPGVGSSRKAIAVQCSSDQGHCFLVGPDNGVLSGVFEDFMDDSKGHQVAAVALTNPYYWRSRLTESIPSCTFHGRDIFAPVAAHLANGVALEALGTRIDPHTLTKSDLPAFKWVKNALASDRLLSKSDCLPLKSEAESVRINHRTRCIGCIQHVDRFGNLISNIPEDAVSGSRWQVTLETARGPLAISSIKTYSDVPLGELAALMGSHGWVEIACNSASAAAALDLPLEGIVGSPVKVQILA